MAATTTPRISGSLSQRAFDTFLRSLAEPGTLHQLPSELLAIDVATPLWLPLAIADVDVSVRITPDPDHHLNDLVVDATGATITELGDAWAVALLDPDPDEVRRLEPGDALHPERGARCAIGVRSLDNGPHRGGPVGQQVQLVLEGPGVPSPRTLSVGGIDAAVAALLGRHDRLYPAGIDAWLMTQDGVVAAIARSTRITIREV